MNIRDWQLLTKYIRENNCILFIGSEFPIQIGEKTTSFSEELKKVLIGDLVNPEVPYNDPTGIQLSELANYYNKRKSREDLEILVSEWYKNQKATLSSPVFEKLISLPFTFIIDTNCFDFFGGLLSKKKKAASGFYNFHGEYISTVDTPTFNNSIGTISEPYIYNLFGSLTDQSSMVISEFELIEMLTKIISKNPGLPNNIKFELKKEDKGFLFIGFGILAKSWYYKILLHTLEFNKKNKTSYAVDYMNLINYSQNSTVVFFKNDLRVNSNNELNPQEFIEKLLEEYGPLPNIPVQEPVYAINKPYVFISYKGEDRLRVSEFVDKLEDGEIKCWFDTEDLRGDINGNIENAIKKEVNAFILFQSKNMENDPVNFANKEIKLAEERAKYYRNRQDFLFACFLDLDAKQIDECLIKDFSPYRLQNEDEIKRLIQDIHRSYERNKSKVALLESHD